MLDKLVWIATIAVGSVVDRHDRFPRDTDVEMSRREVKGNLSIVRPEDTFLSVAQAVVPSKAKILLVPSSGLPSEQQAITACAEAYQHTKASLNLRHRALCLV